MFSVLKSCSIDINIHTLDILLLSLNTSTVWKKNSSCQTREPVWPSCKALGWQAEGPRLYKKKKIQIKKINSASAKCCELDPIPTMLVYENLDILLPSITNIVNTSLTTGTVPRDLKTTVVKLLLKKKITCQKSFEKLPSHL